MSAKTKYVCDICGKEADSYCSEKDWISFEGTITRAHGVYGSAAWKTDYLRGKFDFCSWTCFIQKFVGKSTALETIPTLPDWPEKPKELLP